MQMTDGEICREYRLAKNKREQIRILAELNCTDERSIIDILLRGGEKVRLIPFTGGRKAERDLTDEEYKLVLYRYLDILDKKIAKAEKEYRLALGLLKSFWEEM